MTTNPSAAAVPFALEMRAITKQFPGVRALSAVTIGVRPGHIHALLGENGAGKSTLVKILDGVYPAGEFEGEIVLAGRTVSLRSPHDAQMQGIGYVPQEISVIEDLSVGENIFVGRWREDRGLMVNFTRLHARAAELLRELNLDLDSRRRVATLNASQRQLVMIARAMATRPTVLILDEATACLTGQETANLFRLVRHMQAAGLTTIFITHKMTEVFEIADRATVLRDGAVTAHFERADFNEHEIVAAMVGRKIENFYPTRTSPIGEEEVLRVENLTIPHPHLARKNVVEDVSFTLRRGEILGLGGLVGSGRSEIVNALYGRMPYRGKIHVEGCPARIRNPRDAKSQGIGLLTEDRKRDGLLFNFAIRQNVTLHDLPRVTRMGIMRPQEEKAIAQDFLGRLSIRARSIDTLVATLSGGNQQKVVLAKVLLPRPRVLLLDEPTKGVDVGAKNEIYKLMMDLVRDGMSLIVISSELPELLALCDRYLVLVRGRVADEFTREEGGEQRLILAASGGGRASQAS